MLGGHKPVIKLLSDNGANLSTGDVGMYSCTAAEQNNLDLLKEIVSLGGDVTWPKQNGNTALHAAVCEGNVEIVKFLLDQGASIEVADENGWTAKDLAEQQGHEDIKELFGSLNAIKVDSYVAVNDESHRVHFLGRFKSDPTILPHNQEGSFAASDGSWTRARPRRRTNTYSNSLFGIMSAAQSGDSNLVSPAEPVRAYAARVTISCPEKGDVAGKVVFLPQRFEELVEMGARKYGASPVRVMSIEGADIDDIELVRDGDHVVFATLQPS